MRVGLIIILSFPVLVLAQIKNPSFENWSTVNGIPEPDGWTSRNWVNSTGTNQWVKRIDTMARTGNSCVYVSNEPRAGFEPSRGKLETFFKVTKTTDTLRLYVSIPDSMYFIGRPAIEISAIGLSTLEGPTEEFYTNQTNGFVLWEIPFSFSALPDSVYLEITVGDSQRYQPGAFFDDIFVGKNPLSLSPQRSNEVSVFPNPTQKYLNLQGEFSRNAKITCYNIAGQHFGLVRLASNRLDVSGLPKGVDFLEIKEEGERSTTKFIKE